MDIQANIRQRLVIRVSRASLSFSVVDAAKEDMPVVFEPYTVKSGISIAANLREAFKTADLLQQDFQRALIMIDSPVLLVPTDLFHVAECHDLYVHSYPNRSSEEVLYNAIPDLNVVALFSINKDLKLVIDDHFRNVSFANAVSPVWRHLHQRSYAGTRSKLYGYFHDEKLDIFSFAQNRFKFHNSFDTRNVHDALYFILYVWKQLMLKPEFDELHIAGDIEEREWLMDELKKYLKRAYAINPASDFNRSPVTTIKGMPYDLMTYFVKGR